MKKLEISLVIPSHNASHVIEDTILEYSKFLSSFSKHYEIIVVCNACTDNTIEITGKISRKNKHIKIVKLKEGGKGIAILAGFRKAKYSIIGFLDADNPFDLKSLKNMICQLDNYDCVIASKWLGRGFFQVAEPFTRKILAIGWRMLNLILFGLDFKDTQAGAKFLTKKAFSSINKNFVCKGFDFDVELLYKLKKKGFKIKEVYVPTVKAFKFSTFRLRFVPAMFWHMLRLWSQ